MGAKQGKKSLLKQTEDMREKIFGASRDKYRINPITKVVRLRKREQESELKKWFVDTFDVDLGGEDEDN